MDNWNEWLVGFKEWRRWTIFDEVYALIRLAVCSAAAAAMVAFYAFLKHHPALLNGMIGAVGAMLFIVVVRWLQIRKRRASRVDTAPKLARIWIVGAAVVVLLAWLPVALSYFFPRLIEHQTTPPKTITMSATDTVVASDEGKAVVCPPIPTPAPREISLAEGLSFISDFRLIQGRINIKITAPPEHLDLRNQIVTLLRFPESLLAKTKNTNNRLALYPETFGYINFADGRFSEFNVLDDNQDSGRLAKRQEQDRETAEIVQRLGGDVDATPIPTPTPTPSLSGEFPNGKVIVHCTDSGKAYLIANLFRDLGLNVVTGLRIPADASNYAALTPPIVYVQLGHGSFW